MDEKPEGDTAAADGLGDRGLKRHDVYKQIAEEVVHENATWLRIGWLCLKN